MSRDIFGTLSRFGSGPSRRCPFQRWMMRLCVALVVLALIASMAIAAAAILRFPYATLPALAFAAFGYVRHRNDRATAGELEPAFIGSLRWGTIGGAVTYVLFATVGIGVPAPDAPVRWRLFGAAVFGTAAGIGAALMVELFSLTTEFVPRLPSLWKHFNDY